MLIEVKKPDDILIFKMNTGEQVIAKLASEDGNLFKVYKPATILIQQAEDGSVGVDMQISVVGADINNTVEIYKTSVVMVAKAETALKSAYIQQTTGIVTAPAGILNGQTSS